jgi:tetratricopeptide (TPR) repeat protein
MLKHPKAMINHQDTKAPREQLLNKINNMNSPPCLGALVVKKMAFAVLLLFISVGLSFAEDAVELNNRAVQLMNHGNFDEALINLLKANSMSPTDESIKKNIASCYTIIGNRKMADGKISDAVSEFKSALYYSNDPNIRFSKGYAHYRLGEFEDAVYELEKATDSGLSSPDLYILMGKAFYDKGEMVSAISSWKKGAELYPDNREIKGLLDKAEREAKAEEGYKKDNTSHFIVQFDAGRDEELGRMVLDVLEEAYSDVNLDLAHYPEGNTIVILYAKRAFKEATLSPDWSGGVYDGKIRLPIGGIKEITPELKAVLYHEYTHVVIRSMTGGRTVPTWLNEGMADYEGARFAVRDTAELKKAAREGRLIPLKRLEGSFSTLSDKESSLAYMQSLSIVNYMVERFGINAVRDILEDIGRGDSVETAVKRALEPYGLDYAGLVADWEKSFTR